MLRNKYWKLEKVIKNKNNITMSEYKEPIGFKGTMGKYEIQQEDDSYLHIETNNGVVVASCYCSPIDEITKYDAALLVNAKEAIRALQDLVEWGKKDYAYHSEELIKHIKAAQQVISNSIPK